MHKSLDISSKVVIVCLMAALVLGTTFINSHVISSKLPRFALYAVAAIVILHKRFGASIQSFARLVPVILFMLYLVVITALGNGSLNKGVTLLVPPFVLTLFVLLGSRHEIEAFIDAFVKVVLVLTIIDLVTCVAFPKGLYVTQHARAAYTDNWFLGYKTHRFMLILPMVCFAAVKDHLAYRHLGRRFYAVAALSLVDLVLTKGTTAAFGLFVFVAVVVVYQQINLFRRTSITVSTIFDHRMVIAACLLFLVLIVLLQDYFQLLRIISALFNKSVGLTGRVGIWRAIMRALTNSNGLGFGFIGTKAFEKIAYGAVNAHNQLLEVIVYGGVPGFALYLYVYVDAMRRIVRGHTLSAATFYCALSVFCFYLIGLVSAVPAFTPHLFLCYYLTKRDDFDEQRSFVAPRAIAGHAACEAGLAG